MSSMRSENFWARVIELDLEECIPAMKAKGLVTLDGLSKEHRHHLHAAEGRRPDEGHLAPCLAPAEAHRQRPLGHVGYPGQAQG